SFFFCSRRRHTSFSRDWSSDVCSSDLNRALVCTLTLGKISCQMRSAPRASRRARSIRISIALTRALIQLGLLLEVNPPGAFCARSEERRVGQECTGRRRRADERKKRES